ncbi:MAG TPA: hypothetical protein PK530_02355 [Anaerolineales bacterium]|nr:hypothetical protein [Anaerolineales bacterium]
MINLIFIVVGLIQLGIAMTGTRYTRKYFTSYAVMILGVVYGLTYDNLAISAGAFLGEGEFTKALSWPRYAIHALFTPTMIISAFGILRLAGVKWAQSRTWHTVICVIATALIFYGIYVDILNLNLVPQHQMGVLRYVNDFHLIPGPPLPAITTIFFLLIFGIVLWRHTKWPWLFVGSLFMFITAGVMGVPFIANIGEIGIAGGMVTSMIRVRMSNDA